MNIIIAILIFGIIIIVHELGHFLIAKKNGIQVDEFCIGLGPTIIGKQVGETFYSVKLLPFGGACMMGEDEDRPEKICQGHARHKDNRFGRKHQQAVQAYTCKARKQICYG